MAQQVDQHEGADATVDALLRLTAGRLDAASLAVFQFSGAGCRLWAATGARVDLGDPSDTLLAVQAAGAAGRASGAVTRLDAAGLGPKVAFAAVAPIGRGAAARGLLLVLDKRPRRLGRQAVADLADAAQVLAALMPAAPAAAAVPGREPLSRAEAHALIERTRAAAGAGPGTRALLLVDLDRFRSVHDALGPAAADRVLATVAGRIAGAAGASDRSERLEGDRFLVLTGADSPDPQVRATDLLAAIAAPGGLAGHSITLQASIGVALDEEGLPASRLFAQADTALKRAKAEGGGRVAVHETRLESQSRDLGRLELDLARAVETGEMRLAFQPYVDLATGGVTGAEALLRWHHPTRGRMHPQAFIPLAERCGQILPLGDWALRSALREAERWPDPVRLAVNISALQFHQPDFVAQIDRALAGSDFPAARLELEITETVLMRDNPETIAQLRALIARGIRIALDDFGTGYSALAYLARLPHHRIKLDRTFVQDLGNPATASLIRAIVASARGQGIAITAEGVEQASDVEAVRRMGFTHAQGYATGAPCADPADFLAPSTPVVPA